MGGERRRGEGERYGGRNKKGEKDNRRDGKLELTITPVTLTPVLQEVILLISYGEKKEVKTSGHQNGGREREVLLPQRYYTFSHTGCVN